MKVLKATPDQYEALNGYTNQGARIEFIQDANDNWIVGMDVLTIPEFEPIRPQLEQLEQIPFEPKEDE